MFRAIFVYSCLLECVKALNVRIQSETSLSGHSQCKTLSQSPRHLITYYLWYFADVAAYLLKKEVEKIRLQVLVRI